MENNIFIVPFDVNGHHIEISAPSREIASLLGDNLEGAIKAIPLRTIDTGFDILKNLGFKSFRKDSIYHFLYKVGQMYNVNTPIRRLRDAVIDKLTDYEFSMGLIASYRSTERLDLCQIGTSFSGHQQNQVRSYEISSLPSVKTIPSDTSASFFDQFDEWVHEVISGLASYEGKYREYSMRLMYISQGNLSNKEIGQRTGVTGERIRQEKVKFVSCFREFRLPKVLESELVINELFKQEVMKVKTRIIGLSVEDVMADLGEIGYGKLSFILECMGLHIQQTELGHFIVQAVSVKKIPRESNYHQESVSVHEACVA